MTLVDILLGVFIVIGLATCIWSASEIRKTSRQIKELQKLIEVGEKELKELKGGK